MIFINFQILYSVKNYPKIRIFFHKLLFFFLETSRFCTSFFCLLAKSQNTCKESTSKFFGEVTFGHVTTITVCCFNRRKDSNNSTGKASIPPKAIPHILKSFEKDL